VRTRLAILPLVAVPAVLAVLSCSDKPAPVGPTLAALPIEIMPLVEGAQWNYNMSHSIEQNEKKRTYNKFTITQTRGHLDLAVRAEHGSAFNRTWDLAASLTVDSVTYQHFIDGVPDTSYSVYLNSITTVLFTVEYEQDTLWYSLPEGREYMATAGYRPGGRIDLRLFDFADNGFFRAPLDSAQALGNGDLVFHSFHSGFSAAAKITPTLGPIGVWGQRTEGIFEFGHNWRLEEMRFGLIR